MESTELRPIFLGGQERADARYVAETAQQAGVELTLLETETFCEDCNEPHPGVGFKFESVFGPLAVTTLINAKARHGRN